jgi:uncharacterized protein YggT (Ycf19 family)
MEVVEKLLTLLRFAAFMVIVYLAFGLLIERVSRKPDSQLKAFARVVCTPITRPVARFLAPGADQRRLLLVGMVAVGAVWVVVVLAQGALSAG